MDFIRGTEFLGQYGCTVEECCLLRCDAKHCEVLVRGGACCSLLPALQRNLLSPSVGQKMEAVGFS